MKKLMVVAALSGVSTSALAADISSPNRGVICGNKVGFCVDDQGIAMGLTACIWGKKRRKNWRTR